MKREFAIHHWPVLDRVDGKLVKSTMLRRVRVMARAEGYAMVRNPGASPFVVPEKELGPDDAAIQRAQGRG